MLVILGSSDTGFSNTLGHWRVSPIELSTIVRILLLAAGFTSLGLGIVGAILPLLPTTPFLLVAAFCFARSSERFHSAMMSNRWAGPYLSNYRDGRPLSQSQLASTLMALWTSLAATAFFIRNWWLWGLLAAVALGVTTYLVTRNNRLRTSSSRNKLASLSVMRSETNTWKFYCKCGYIKPFSGGSESDAWELAREDGWDRAPADDPAFSSVIESTRNHDDAVAAICPNCRRR